MKPNVYREVVLPELRREIEMVLGRAATPEDFVLFGSSVLLLHELRESIGDIDLFVSEHLWGCCEISTRWRTQRPRPDDPPFLVKPLVGGVEAHAFLAWTQRDREWMKVEDAWESLEIVNGWPCVSLEYMRQIKQGAFDHNPGSVFHLKHERDLKLIEEVLERS